MLFYLCLLENLVGWLVVRCSQWFYISRQPSALIRIKIKEPNISTFITKDLVLSTKYLSSYKEGFLFLGSIRETPYIYLVPISNKKENISPPLLALPSILNPLLKIVAAVPVFGGGWPIAVLLFGHDVDHWDTYWNKQPINIYLIWVSMPRTSDNPPKLRHLQNINFC